MHNLVRGELVPTSKATTNLRDAGSVFLATRPRQANVLSMATGIVNAENGNLSGGEVGTFWNHTYSEKAASTLQVSFDRCERYVPFTGNRDAFDAVVGT
jgi:hypothetical protein